MVLQGAVMSDLPVDAALWVTKLRMVLYGAVMSDLPVDAALWVTNNSEWSCRAS